MTGNRSQLMNFVSKFLGTVRFRNDQVAKIIGFGNYQQGNVIISRVYYVERLRHNLFSVRQFCDTDLEVAFRKNTCFIRNLEGVDLLSGSRDTNLYTISLDDMLNTSLICLLSKASKTKSWLWHRRLSHLNFGTLNKLAKDGLARGIPKLKFQKDHMCSACALGKSKKSSHQPKVEDTNQEKLYLFAYESLWPDASKGEAPEAIIKCIKNLQVHLNATVRNVRTDNGTEFVNQTLRDFYENVGISHQTSVARTPQQNDIVERRNRTLVEAARTMLIFSKAPLLLWAEAINTPCYTQNRSLIHLRYNKTPYELMHDKKPDLSFFHVFGSLCYPTNDSEDLGKLNAKADIAMASEQFGSGPGLQVMTPATSSSGLVLLLQELLIKPVHLRQQPLIKMYHLLVLYQQIRKFNLKSFIKELKNKFMEIKNAQFDNASLLYNLSSDSSSKEITLQGVIPSNLYHLNQSFDTLTKLTKNHPLENVIGDPSRPVSTRSQLQEHAILCYFDANDNPIPFGGKRSG
ncbi:retrovirus-related pol polyprotein from transposon TNT 1-94 [Tanacetum coccineum]|uniref:Retrovirus-related pol polyprotein from transposon TNT 1-94 n=1 Tax=Tanacetum coccineum TaxID=301880 RepID=A0ABQ5FAG5_9ASTR